MKRKKPDGAPTTLVIYVLSICLCLLAVAAEFAFLVLATNNSWTLGTGNALILDYMLGPHMALASIAWLARLHRGLTWALLAVILAVTLGVSGTHAYRYLTEMQYRHIQQSGKFMMPLGQWSIGFYLAIVVLYYRLQRRIWQSIQG